MHCRGPVYMCVCSAEVGMVGLLTGRCTLLLHPLTAASLLNNTLQSFICRHHQLLTNGLTEWRQDAVPVKLESTVWAAGQLLLTTQLKGIKNWNYPRTGITSKFLALAAYSTVQRKTLEGKFLRSLQARLLSVVFSTKCHISLSLEFSIDPICADCSLLIYNN